MPSLASPDACAIIEPNRIAPDPFCPFELVSKVAEDIRADLAVTGAAACHREYFAVIELAAVVGMRLKAVIFIGRVAPDRLGMGHDVYSAP